MSIDEFMAEWRDDGEQLLVHTSGSTGTPKPLWVEKRRMEASARITCRFLQLHEGDSALLCMPLDYIAGKMMVVRALTCGLQLVCVKPSTHPFADEHVAQQRGGFDLVGMVPLQVWHTLQVPAERERLMQTRHLLIGGGAVDGGLERQLQDFPHAVWSTYGMTETLSHVALRRLNGPDRSDYYTPFEGVGVSLDTDGCLVIDAPAVCAVPLVTNDRAGLAADGRRFRILGRRDNIVCSGGIKLQIETIEQKLQPHMGVPFMITKRSDPAFGEVVVLLVEDVDTRRYAGVCRRVLSRYECPKEVLGVARLPLTETGKPARKAAQELVSRSVCR